MLSKIRHLFSEAIIIREWIENEEFIKVDQIIVIGTRLQAFVINLLFRESGKKVYYITEAEGKYKYRRRMKWIVFNNDFKKVFPENDCSILFMPHI